MAKRNQRSYRGLRAETRRMLEGEEDYDVEFKESLSSLDADDLVAFANSKRGGSILIGVREVPTGKGRIRKGAVIGCEIGDGPKRSIISKATSCRPKIHVEITAENTAHKPIYRIDIPSGPDKPYCTEGGTYKIRRDGAKQALDPTALKGMILELESNVFISRFKHVAEDILSALTQTENNLDRKLAFLEQLVVEAEEAASAAAETAQWAVDEITSIGSEWT